MRNKPAGLVAPVAWRVPSVGALALVLGVLVVLAGPPTLAAQPAVPELTGRVMDTAGLLGSSTRQTLTQLLEQHEDSTGNQVVVLTIPSLEGGSIEEYAVEVAETWALGQEGRDNGVLVLVSRDDRELRIEVGYGLEGALTDALSSRIIRNEFIPSFRNGDYDSGILTGTEAVLRAVEGE